MASYYEHYDIKNELIKRSNNQEKIIDVARNDSDWHVRLFAVAYIEDEEVLKDILVNDSIQFVSIKAMEQISDIDFLVDTCLNNPFSHIRLATLNRIIVESLLSESDLADLLNHVALNDPNDFIVKIALENTDSYDPETIMLIAKSMRDEEIRKIAVSKITDGKILSDFRGTAGAGSIDGDGNHAWEKTDQLFLSCPFALSAASAAGFAKQNIRSETGNASVRRTDSQNGRAASRAIPYDSIRVCRQG